MSTYDVAVIGTGGVGSAAVYALAKAGAKVIGLDRFDPPHNRGSSHGDTRVIRKAYFEHPDYVPLLQQAYRGWQHLEEAAGKQLYFPTGVLQIGPSEGEIISGIRQSAQEHGLEIESYACEELSQVFPGIHPPENTVGILERDAGYLLVSQCIAAYLRLAKELGADLRINTPALAWHPRKGEYVLETADEVIQAKQLVICGGPWALQLLADLEVPMRILQKHLYWYDNQAPEYTSDASFPVFLMETSGGLYYGFPQIDAQGVKVSRHDGGKPIDHAGWHAQMEDASDRADVETFLSACLPKLSHEVNRQAACLYTMTPDEHFLLGTHPRHKGLHFAAGLSGHGFKFASALGEILCDLAVKEKTSAPIGFLRATRFS